MFGTCKYFDTSGGHHRQPPNKVTTTTTTVFVSIFEKYIYLVNKKTIT